MRVAHSRDSETCASALLLLNTTENTAKKTNNFFILTNRFEKITLKAKLVFSANRQNDLTKKWKEQI